MSIIFLIVQIFIGGMFSGIAFITSDPSYLMMLLFLLYIFTLITGTYFDGILSLYSLFLLTLGLFNFSRIFLNNFGLIDNFSTGFDFGTNFNFSYIVQIELLKNYIYFLFFLNLGFLINKILQRDGDFNSIIIDNDANLEKISSFVFYITAPLYFIKMFYELIFVIKNGYLSIYNGSLSGNTILPGIGTIFLFNYYIFLSSVPEYKKYKKVTVIFLLLSILASLKGSRSGIMLNILLILFYSSRVYNIKFKLKKLSVIALISLIFMRYIAYFRSGSEFNLISDFKNIFIGFFYGQGTSVLVPAFFLKYKTELTNHITPYIISHGINPFKELVFRNISVGGQSKELLLLRNSLPDNLMYLISPELYLRGNGTGNSIVAEFLEFGSFGLIILTFFYGKYIEWFNRKILTKRIWFVGGVYLLRGILWSPRGPSIPNFLYVILMIVIYQIYKMTIKILLGIKEQECNNH